MSQLLNTLLYTGSIFQHWSTGTPYNQAKTMLHLLTGPQISLVAAMFCLNSSSGLAPTPALEACLCRPWKLAPRRLSDFKTGKQFYYGTTTESATLGHFEGVND
jgi:hypothetical protein